MQPIFGKFAELIELKNVKNYAGDTQLDESGSF